MRREVGRKRGRKERRKTEIHKVRQRGRRKDRKTARKKELLSVSLYRYNMCNIYIYRERKTLIEKGGAIKRKKSEH